MNENVKIQRLTGEKLVKIIGVSSPSTIKSCATQLGIPTLEVFVRLVIEDENENQATVSQKLRILTKQGYEKCLEAKKTGELLNITCTNDGYFYIEDNNTTIDDLFNEDELKVETEKRIKNNNSALNKMFSGFGA